MIDGNQDVQADIGILIVATALALVAPIKLPVTTSATPPLIALHTKLAQQPNESPAS
jgi:hypothetical protein